MAKKEQPPPETLRDRDFRRRLSSRGWTRTSDSVVNSHLLYQLSYAGIDGKR